MPQLPTQSAAPVVAHAVHAPVHHAVHPVAHAAPVVAHAVHAAPVIAHAAPVVAHAVHAAPAETYPDEVSPYTFTYAVADDYSKSNFNAEEQSDGASNVAGSYSVALPDGRIQHVKYSPMVMMDMSPMSHTRELLSTPRRNHTSQPQLQPTTLKTFIVFCQYLFKLFIDHNTKK